MRAEGTLRTIWLVALCGVAAYAIAMTARAYDALPQVIQLHLGTIVPADSGPKQSLLVIPIFTIVICVAAYLQYLKRAASHAKVFQQLSLAFALSSSVLLVTGEKAVIVANTATPQSHAYFNAMLALLALTLALAAAAGATAKIAA